MLLKTDGYYCEMGWEGKGGAGAGRESSKSSLQEEPVCAQWSRKQPESSWAQNTVLGTGLQQQHSSKDAQHWQGNQEPSVSQACRAACVPWSCPLVLCLQLAGSETPCLGWDSISCNQAHLSFRALPYCAKRETFPSLEGLHRQSKQVSLHPVRQLAVFYMSGDQERCHQFSQFSCVGSVVGSELHPVSWSQFYPLFWLHFDEVTILCLITCAARELERDDNLQLNLWTRVHHDYRHAKISTAASVIINKITNAFI